MAEHETAPAEAGAPPPEPAAPVAAPEPAPAPEPPAAEPPGVAELRAELAELRALLGGETTARERAEQLAREQTDALAERDRRLAEREAQAREQDRQARQAELRRALAVSLAGADLVSAAAATQLVDLWAGDFEAVDVPGGGIVVRDRQGLRAPADVVKERLESKDWHHFVKSNNRGGTGGAGGTAAPGSDRPVQARPGSTSTGQPLADQMLAERAARAGNLPSWFGGRL